MSVRNGLIGYFDILGYQDLLINNKPEDIAESVLQKLNSIKGTIRAELEKIFALDIRPHEQDMLNSTDFLIFSDTILVTTNVPENEDARILAERWAAFLFTCASVQNYLFHEGLPSRGVINYGEYLIKDTCVAGRPIVEAHQLANQLELAATILTERAETELDKIRPAQIGDITASNIFDFFVCKYFVPLKKTEKHYLTLFFDDEISRQGDTRQKVLNSFWTHSKDISKSTQQKATNTEQFLRHSIYARKQISLQAKKSF
jgi:hypothetical protein